MYELLRKEQTSKKILSRILGNTAAHWPNPNLDATHFMMDKAEDPEIFENIYDMVKKYWSYAGKQDDTIGRPDWP